MPVVWKAVIVINRWEYVPTNSYAVNLPSGTGISPDRLPLKMLSPMSNVVSPGEAGSQSLICSNRQLSVIATEQVHLVARFAYEYHK